MSLIPSNTSNTTSGSVSGTELPNTTSGSVLGTELPPGYSMIHLIMTVVIVSVIILLIIVGNLLVVIATYTDKNLKSKQNWFIASLALADFLLGLVIMPFSLANEVMGYWYFGSIWCDLWKAIDVLLCTASILSICLISLDRYWCITKALTYPRQRTATRAALMIAAVWILSLIICVPPLIGWKNPLSVTDYPLCLLSSEVGYIISSCMGSFYIPGVIMVVVYYKIYVAATERARKQTKNEKKPKKKEKKSEKEKNGLITEKIAVVEQECINMPAKVNSMTLTDDESTWPMYQKQTTNEEESGNLLETGNGCIDQNRDIIDDGNDEKESTKSNITGTAHLTSNQGENKQDFSYNNETIKDIERQKRKIAKARERRATIVLGIVMATFIVCWAPFFTLYVIKALCSCIPDIAFNVFFWAGYCNSALNPIIYTVFNRDFRHAFKRILCRMPYHR
ncbi:5-hydroxytryptamine receptor 1D-like [Ostrea edulis]|uniref:5-hydroxytryptamine receptor 1D-like n=1 Tax=Ostrea edulis TaxID=37623 RepID=UPI0024AEEAC0|nr:5-hydroxytryptamine receptor 1D-like [Ostrea edulis]XP_056005874.1 5-hydroxytryptamine receptor 1D-like [Ostrea edulis]